MTSERIEDALDAFIRSKQKGTDSGNYQRNARRAIEEWIGWLAGREKPIGTSDQLISWPFSTGACTRNSSLRTQREHGERKKSSRTRGLGAIVNSSGVELIGKRFLPI